MDVYFALADPTRRNILEILAAHGQLSSSAIASRFQMSAPAISQHLKILRAAGLVHMHKKAQHRIYSVNREAMAEVEAWAKQMTQSWEHRFQKIDKLLEETK